LELEELLKKMRKWGLFWGYFGANLSYRAIFEGKGTNIIMIELFLNELIRIINLAKKNGNDFDLQE
jgi:hypothetical protein